ncbi:ATP-dependent helicase [Propionibacteriaceae bacterium Y2011]
MSDHRSSHPSLAAFSPATRTWFGDVFAEPTPVQQQTWSAVAGGDHALVVAPTGSGKTLAAFLWALDRLTTAPVPAKERRCRVLYVSPLKALAVDVQRNLSAPLTGIARTAGRLGTEVAEVSVAIRSGDTSAADRRRIVTRPPDILITTPESLFLLLTSQAKEVLTSVDTVIIDEVHALAGTKRGAHLALSLERLAEACEVEPQRIGLSATVRPRERVARFLAGDRPVRVVAPEAAKTWELEVVVPLPDLTQLDAPPTDAVAAGDAEPPSRSIWPHVSEKVLDLVEQHTSTIVFTNSRRVAERLTTRLNELHAERLGVEVDDDHAPPAAIIAQSGSGHPQPEGVPAIARAHHGSVSKKQREHTESALKSGALRCVVATSSLELGIDMGAVDLVVQVAAPPSVASGLQRVGRAGHQVGAVSRGVVFPQYRGDLIDAAVVLDRMRQGAIEEVAELVNPIDVLAQHVVSMCALGDRDVEATFTMIRRAAPYAELPMSVYESVLDMLSGRYPSEDFAELRPRLVWDRVAGTLTGRPGTQRLAVTSGGTIPDRGLFGVYLVGGEEDTAPSGGRRGGRRVGELDEEMVYESRVGDVITLGTSTWRVEEITHDQVRVSPAPGLPGRLPFWKGDAPARPAELGRAVGAFTAEVAGLPRPTARDRLAEVGLDEWAIDNLLGYVDEQRAATGDLPTDTVVVVERFRDELGDWQLCVHSSLGLGVLAPWALAIERSARERYGVEVSATAGNDGIVLRVPDTADTAPGADLVIMDADELREVIIDEVLGSALFASRFRECAARALLLPRRDPGARSPLWQQRMRAAQLLGVATRFPDFPIVLETMRECLNDVFELDELITLHRQIAARRVRVVEVETARPSPYAKSLLFGYVGEYVYAGDLPLAERRSAALSLDTDLLTELLGGDQLRQILDPAVIAQVADEVQGRTADRRARTVEQLFDRLRTSGPYDDAELAERWARPESAVESAGEDEVAADSDVDPAAEVVAGDPALTAALAELVAARRVAVVRIAGVDRYAVAEDLPRLRDGLGVPVPPGMAVPEPSPDPLGDLVLRWARTHGPFTAQAIADRYGLGTAVVDDALRALVRAGAVVRATFTDELDGPQYCHARVLATIKRRTLAALRAEVEPCEPAALGRFLPRWQQVSPAGSRPRAAGGDGVMAVVEQLAGTVLPVSMLESMIMPVRVADYSPALLDELITSGEVQWVGAGTIGDNDGWLRLLPTGIEPPPVAELPPSSELATSVLARLSAGGGWFVEDLVPEGGNTGDTLDALWELAWAGLVTSDTLAPLRARLAGTRGAVRRTPQTRTRRATARRIRPPVRPGATGRWSLVRRSEVSLTARIADEVLGLLDRYGVLTRGSVTAEDLPGGFHAAYQALSRLEESGTCRRGYFVAGLGAAQFALPGAVDELRSLSGDAPPTERPSSTPTDHPSTNPTESPSSLSRRPVHVLAACDPANPYGAALPWPAREGHRPGRNPGALVALVDGELAGYLERGGKSVLTFPVTTPEGDRQALDALAAELRRGVLGTVTLERIDSTDVFAHPDRQAWVDRGFAMVPQGLRLRPAQH